MVEIAYRAEIFEEDGQYVGLSPDLDVSSFGDTPEEARESLQEAVEAFVEGCIELGTLEEVLRESGFILASGVWRIRDRTNVQMTATVA